MDSSQWLITRQKKPPYRWDFIYMLSVPWRCWEVYYTQTSRKRLHPMFSKPVATFLTVQSKCLFLLGKVSAIIRKEKKRQIKTEFMNPKQFLERHVPLLQLFFSYKWISSEAIWHFFSMKYHQFLPLSYATVTLMYFSHRTITFGTTLS